MSEQQFISMLIDLKSWHQKRVDNCQMIIDNKDADICMDMGNGEFTKFPAHSVQACFIRIGVQLALLQFQPFPITMKQADEDMDEGDEDE